MDLIHKLMNIGLPIVSFFAAILFLPPFVLFKLVRYILRSIFYENVAGKVVLITGASSGIGEHLSYEYAKRGACLALVARREDRLQTVASKSRQIGSPEVIVIPADISRVDDCKRIVDEVVTHFGRLDHLVNNAGVAPLHMFEDHMWFADHASVMNINFWGSVYSTQFAIPHLRTSKGKIAVIASVAGWLPTPKLSLYCASKAALISFYETLRSEVGSDIGITIVTPGLVDSEITQGDFPAKANRKFVPLVTTERCAMAIVNSTIRGESYLTEPAWTRVLLLWKVLCPEVVD
ncbi:hypothetical protein RJ640_014042, partial [Escallonia rubra]